MQVSYAIGVAKPMGIFVDTYGTSNIDMNDSEIAVIVADVFDMRPAALIERLKLKSPIYCQTAAYGHMGRDSEKKSLTFEIGKESKKIEVETFTWEKLDYVDQVKAAFKL